MKLPMQSAQRELAQLNNMISKSTELTFKVTIEEANLVLAGLQELPAKVSNPLTIKIQQQAREQLPEPEKSETK
jgi:hypothetical protein